MEEVKDGWPIKLFASAADWRQWLSENAQANGVWLRFYKKGHGESINYAIALEEALCFGWIDSQAVKYDDDSYLQKFTPRRSKSMWSKRNIGIVERLITEGRMTPRGMAEIEAAKADGRWQRAYDSPTDMQVPADFLKELVAHPKAEAFFATLNKTNTYAIAWRLQTAKTDATRQRRMAALIAMLNNQEKLH